MPVDEFHRAVAATALRAAARYGFALGGGNALIAYGLIDRPTQDVDLFTDREHGVRAFASLERLLDTCDAVTIAVPPDIQAGIALQAAEAGKRLIMEKPVSRDIASAHRAGTRVMSIVAVCVKTARLRSAPRPRTRRRCA